MHTTHITVLLGTSLATVALVAVSAQEWAGEPAMLHACYVPASGQVYRIGAEGLPDVCRSPRHVEFSWNERGPEGPAGEPGEDGEAGLACWDRDGDGVGQPSEDVNNDGDYNALDCQGPAAPFPAAYTTANGLYSMRVADDGIVLAGPDGSVTLDATGIDIESTGRVDVTGFQVQMASQTLLTLDAGVSVNIQGGALTSLSATAIRLNGGCRPVARTFDPVLVNVNETGVISAGSPSVQAC